MKKYLWIVEELEIKIKYEEDRQAELEEKRHKLKYLVYELGEKIKKIENKISTLEYRIVKNNSFMERWNARRIKSLAGLTLPVSALLIASRFESLFHFGALASTIAGAMSMSYAVYVAFNNICKRKQSENEEYTNIIKELKKESAGLNEEVLYNQNEIINIDKEIEFSKENIKEYQRNLQETVNVWNVELDKKIDKIPNQEEEITVVDPKVLRKIAPKELIEDLVQEEKIA